MATTPRGIRNNNPGNLERNDIAWQGMSAQQPDPRFASFDSPEYGIRALGKLLSNYQKFHGIRTVQGVTERYAPNHENPTDAYAQHLAGRLGVAPDAEIDLTDPATIEPLVNAVIEFENGGNPYDAGTVRKGLELAGLSPAPAQEGGPSGPFSSAPTVGSGSPAAASNRPPRPEDFGLGGAKAATPQPHPQPAPRPQDPQMRPAAMKAPRPEDFGLPGQSPDGSYTRADVQRWQESYPVGQRPQAPQAPQQPGPQPEALPPKPGRKPEGVNMEPAGGLASLLLGLQRDTTTDQLYFRDQDGPVRDALGIPSPGRMVAKGVTDLARGAATLPFDVVGADETGDAVGRAIPRVQTKGLVEDVGGALVQFGIPGTAAIKIADRLTKTQGIGRWLAAGGASALSDAVAADPRSQESLTNMFGAQGGLGERVETGIEGGALNMAFDTILGAIRRARGGADEAAGPDLDDGSASLPPPTQPGGPQAGADPHADAQARAQARRDEDFARRAGEEERDRQAKSDFEDLRARAENRQQQRRERDRDQARREQQRREYEERRRWSRQQYEEEFRQRQQREGAQQRQQAGSTAPSSNKEAPFDEATDGFPETEDGFVASDKGGPIKFGDQRQAASWIVKRGNQQGSQIFEVANHPGGGFTVRVRGRRQAEEPEPEAEEGPRPGARQERQGGPRQAGPRQAGARQAQPGQEPETPGNILSLDAPRRPRQTQREAPAGPARADEERVVYGRFGQDAQQQPRQAAPELAAPRQAEPEPPAPGASDDGTVVQTPRGEGRIIKQHDGWARVRDQDGKVRDYRDGRLRYSDQAEPEAAPAQQAEPEAPAAREEGDYERSQREAEEARVARNADAEPADRELKPLDRKGMDGTRADQHGADLSAASDAYEARYGVQKVHTSAEHAFTMGYLHGRDGGITFNKAWEQLDRGAKKAKNAQARFREGFEDGLRSRGDIEAPEEYLPPQSRQTDQTDQGAQDVVPGAERIGDRELAERGSQGRAKGKAPQQAADDGLFDTGARRQTDLMDQPAAKPKAEGSPKPGQITNKSWNARLNEVEDYARFGDNADPDAADPELIGRIKKLRPRGLEGDPNGAKLRELEEEVARQRGAGRQAEEPAPAPKAEEPAKPKTLQRRVMDVVGDGKTSLTPQAVAKKLGAKPKDVSKVLEGLAESGTILKRRGTNAYRRRSAKGKEVYNDRPLDIVEWIAARGGIQPDGDLQGMIGKSNHFVPKMGNMLRQGGDTADGTREAATELGYLGRGNRDTSETTINDLYEAIDETLRGRRVFAEGADADEMARRAEAHEAEEQRVRFRDEAEMTAKEYGVDLDDEALDEAGQRIAAGDDPVDAMSDAAEAMGRRRQDETFDDAARAGEDDIPFPGEEGADDAYGPGRTSQADPQSGGSGGRSGNVGGASRGPGAAGEEPPGRGTGAAGQGREAAQGREAEEGVGKSKGTSKDTPKRKRGSTTLSANPFADPARLREAGPELVGGLVGGFIGNYYEHGEVGFSPKWAAIGIGSMAGSMRLPIKGRTALGGKDSWAATGLAAAPDKLLSHVGLRYLHPRNGTTENLWDRIQAFRQEQRNWTTDATDVARNYAERFTPEERRLISDVIEKEGDWQNAPKAVRDGAKTMSENADALGRQLSDLDMLDEKARAALEGGYLHRYYAPKISQSAKRLFRGQKRAKETISGSYARRRGETRTIKQPTGPREPKMGEAIYEMFSPTTGKKRYVRQPEVNGLRNKGFATTRKWTVDHLDGENMRLHRDYTRKEREAMGEIRDAAYRYAAGMMEAGHDLALGRMFKEFAEDPRYASTTAKDGWWKVPDSNVPGTSVKKYGKLAGMYAHPDLRKALEVVRHPTMNQTLAGSEAAQDLFSAYTRALGAWKISKTAYNPATHFNNMASNVSLAAMDGEIGPMDVYRASKMLWGSRGNRADQAIVREAKKAGLSLDVEANLGDELRSFGPKIEGMGENTQGGWSRLMEMFTRNAITRTYGAEDQAFKLAYYTKMRAKGLSERESVKATHKLFFDYGDVPLGVDTMRKAPLPVIGSPFFTYTYKAVPAMMRLMAEKPHRVLAAFGVMNGISIGSYGYLYGEQGARDREKYEREVMPDYQKGRTSIGTRRSIRLPFNTEDSLTGEAMPNMLNTYYFVPAGNALDLTSSNDDLTGGWWPQAISGTVLGGNPLIQGVYGMLTDKDPFFGKEISSYQNTSYFDPEDPSWQKVENLKDQFGFLSRQFLPPIFNTIPEKVGNAAVGGDMLDPGSDVATFMEWTGQDYLGRQLSLMQAAAHVAGVKVNNFSPGDQERFKRYQARTEVEEAKTALYKALRNDRIARTTEDERRRALREAMDLYQKRLRRLDELREAAPDKTRLGPRKELATEGR